MPLIRPEARAMLWRAREVLVSGVLAAFGGWLVALGGYLLIPVGVAVVALALGLALLGWRRMRFAQAGTAPGMVEVDEAQVSYMGPAFGGYVSLDELAELRLVTAGGRRLWRLKQDDGQVLLIPVEATGAERLFDAFASLPGMETQRLVAALHPQNATPKATPTGASNASRSATSGPGLRLVVASAAAPDSRVIWRRPARAVLT